MELAGKFIALTEIIFMIYLGLAAFYFLLFAIASRFYREEPNDRVRILKRIAILIPAYKEDSVIVETARSAMLHRSLSSALEVIVVADTLTPETRDRIRETGARVLPVSFDKSTKSKAVLHGLDAITQRCDYVVILDADNRMEEGFVDRIVQVAMKGFRVVQGHRTAKNSNTSLAVLDGLSEEINNAIFRKGHRVLGLSASLIGSGFIIEYDLLKNLMKQARAVGGFDKELELLILERKIRIAYAGQAIVYDEKIQQAGAFVNQRRRWISAQFTYLGRNIRPGFIQLLRHGNIDYFEKLLQFVPPPRIVTLGLATILSLIHTLSMVLNVSAVGWMAIAWFSTLAATLLAIFLSIPQIKFGKSLYRSLLYLPSGFLLMLKALLKTKGANKNFIHTDHIETT